ncbi:SGNH/GDSL hydrolase family protein, partial [Escherichia coli]
MPDAWDNMQSIDKFVNSSDETITTRTGEQLDTLHGVNVKADNQLTQQQADFETSQEERDAVVEETRQNLIPLSRQYMTLAAAQADIANIPEGSTTYYRSPDDSALAIEAINNAGTLTATGRKMPAYSSLRRGNILFDAFNEYSSSLLTFANWDWYKGATPTFSTTDVNLPLPTPVIQASGVTSFDKYYDVSKLQVKPGDTLAFSVLVWFENAGGKLQIYWLDSAGVTITTGEASPLVAGISSPVVVIAVPSGASSIRIRVQNTVSGAFKIGAYAAAIGDVTPEFTRSFPSKAYQEALGTPDNLVYDPFGEMLSVR